MISPGKGGRKSRGLDGLLGRGIYLGPILEDLIAFFYSNGANIPKPPIFTRPSRVSCPVLVRSSLRFRLPTLPKSFRLNLFYSIPQYFVIANRPASTKTPPSCLLQFSWAPTDDI